MQRSTNSNPSSSTPNDYWRDVHSAAWQNQAPPTSTKIVLAPTPGSAQNASVDQNGTLVTDAWQAHLRCCPVPMHPFYLAYKVPNPSALPFIPFDTGASYARTSGLQGVAMTEAVDGRMYGAQEEMRALQYPKIDFILAWPGEKPWTKRLTVRKGPDPSSPFVTRQELARKIARALHEFVDFMGPGAYSNAVWSVHGGPIGLDVLRILRLVNIEPGSDAWVAEIAVMCC